MREKREYKLLGDKSTIMSIIERIDPLVASYGFRTIELYINTDKHSMLIKECERLGVELRILRFEMEYSNFELDNARFLNLHMRTYCSDFSDEYGTIYNYDNKCSCCSSGREQVSDLFIDKAKMGKKDISLTHDFKVVLSEKLHKILIQNGVTGVEFGNVQHKNNKMKNEPMLYQLLVKNVLPNLNKLSTFYKEQYCECCNKSGLYLNSLPYYSEASLSNAQDFNYTKEYFGGGYSGKPYIIVSQKVYRLFRDNKIKGTHFDVVNIV